MIRGFRPAQRPLSLLPPQRRDVKILHLLLSGFGQLLPDVSLVAAVAAVVVVIAPRRAGESTTESAERRVRSKYQTQLL